MRDRDARDTGPGGHRPGPGSRTLSRSPCLPAGVVERTAGDVVACVFSRSTAQHLFGSRLGDFERDLRAVLRQASADGVFAEQLPDTEILLGTQPARPPITAHHEDPQAARPVVVPQPTCPRPTK
jgi:hypothetical protein